MRACGPHACGNAMRNATGRDGTGRDGTERKNHQDTAEHRPVPDAVGAVDNGSAARHRVVVDLPAPTWFQLAEIAEGREIEVSWLIAHAIRDLLGSEHTRLAVARARRERIAALARQGLTDAVICERTGETRDYVATNRRKAGIAPNRPGRATTERKTA